MSGRTRSLRRQQTDAEQKLWYRLRDRRCAEFKFRRQHEISPYIVDFVCLQRNLVVELDGGQHGEWFARDAARTEFLRSLGFRVIRFWDNEVLMRTDTVVEVIHEALARPPHPGPLP